MSEQRLCPAGLPVPDGTTEWELIPGPKGDKGEKGASRLPGRQAWAIVVLVVIVLAINGASLFWQAHETNANQAQQRRQGEQIERKICIDVVTMAAIQPPSGPPARNPSRAYEDAEHRAWAGLVLAVGCKAGNSSRKAAG